MKSASKATLEPTFGVKYRGERSQLLEMSKIHHLTLKLNPHLYAKLGDLAHQQGFVQKMGKYRGEPDRAAFILEILQQNMTQFLSELEENRGNQPA